MTKILLLTSPRGGEMKGEGHFGYYGDWELGIWDLEFVILEGFYEISRDRLQHYERRTASL